MTVFQKWAVWNKGPLRGFSSFKSKKVFTAIDKNFVRYIGIITFLQEKKEQKENI